MRPLACCRVTASKPLLGFSSPAQMLPRQGSNVLSALPDMFQLVKGACGTWHGLLQQQHSNSGATSQALKYTRSFCSCASAHRPNSSTAPDASDATPNTAMKQVAAAQQQPAVPGDRQGTANSSKRRYRRTSRRTTSTAVEQSLESQQQQQQGWQPQQQPQQQLGWHAAAPQAQHPSQLKLGAMLLQQNQQPAEPPQSLGAMVLRQAPPAAGTVPPYPHVPPSAMAAGAAVHQQEPELASAQGQNNQQQQQHSSNQSVAVMARRASSRVMPEVSPTAHELGVPRSLHYMAQMDCEPLQQQQVVSVEFDTPPGPEAEAAAAEAAADALAAARAGERSTLMRALVPPNLSVGAVVLERLDDAAVTALANADAAAAAVAWRSVNAPSQGTFGVPVVPDSAAGVGDRQVADASSLLTTSRRRRNTTSTGSSRSSSTTTTSRTRTSRSASSSTISRGSSRTTTSSFGTASSTTSRGIISWSSNRGWQEAPAAAPPAPAGTELSEQQVLLELAELLADKGIQLDDLRFGQQRTTCPECQGGSAGEDCFSVNLMHEGSAVWLCHRASCGNRGGVKVKQGGQHRASWSSSSAGAAEAQARVPPNLSRLRPLSPELLAWFQQRGISAHTLQRNNVQMEARWCRALDACVDHAAFPFSVGGVVVNIKYRAPPKHFQQSAKGDQVFYGLDGVRGAREVIIVEGEMDKLAVDEATGGNTAVISVPAGAAAPAAHQQQQQQVFSSTNSSSSSSSSGSSKRDRKFAYVAKAEPVLASCSSIVIAVDGDAAGRHTAMELASRLGWQRCSYLAWPACEGLGPAALQRVAAAAAQLGMHVDIAAGLRCKDANDVLMCYGRDVLALYLQHAPVKFTPPGGQSHDCC